MAVQKNEKAAPLVSKDNVRALVKKLRAGQAAGADVDVFQLALGPNPGCLSSKQILKAVVVGITDKEREHVIGCLPCLEHLRRIAEVDCTPDTGFVRRMLSRFEPQEKKAAAFAPAAGMVSAQGAFHAIFATLSRVQKLNPVAPLSRAFKVDLVPLFDLEPFQFDQNSFELKGAFQTSTIDRIEKVDVNRDGQCDFLRITFSNLKPSRQIAEAIAAKRTIYDTVRLVGKMQDKKNKKFSVVAQANLEFKGK